MQAQPVSKNQAAVDPVCGMEVKKATWKSVYQNHTYSFCSAACKKNFDAAPAERLAEAKSSQFPPYRDPVCGMWVYEATLKSSHGQKDYAFCSAGCKKKFDANPAGYLTQQVPGGTKTAKAEKGVVYLCPMHPAVRQEEPGSCRLCGMALEKTGGASTSLAEDPEYQLLQRNTLACFLSLVPLMLIAMRAWYVDFIPLAILTTLEASFTALLPAGWSRSVGLAALEALFSLPALWYGRIFFERGYQSVRNRSLNMFSLISLGTLMAYGYSFTQFGLVVLKTPASLNGLGGGFYFEAGATIITLVYLGQLLEKRALTQTSGLLSSLEGQLPKEVAKVNSLREQTPIIIPLTAAQVGELILIRPGEKIPFDGLVVSGSGEVEEAMLTGEAQAVAKQVGDQTYAGTLNSKLSSFIVKITALPEESVLSKIIQLASEAQRSRAPVQQLVDKVSAYFVPAVVLLACFTFFFWYWAADKALSLALRNAVAVLIIACPCALGLATPLSVVLGIGRAAQRGMLIRNAGVLERMRKIKTLLVDKTGTLTEGKLAVSHCLLNPSLKQRAKIHPRAVARYAASLAKNSEHPLAKALVKYAETEPSSSLVGVEQFKNFPGQGVSGRMEGSHFYLGSKNFIEQETGQPAYFESLSARLSQEKNSSLAFLACEKEVWAAFLFKDRLKASTPGAIKELQRNGIEVMILTGDRLENASALAAQLGIKQYRAELRPAEKLKYVRALQKKGPVAMAGDGINDAPALGAAAVSFAMGSGSALTIEKADVTLVKGDLKALWALLRLSRVVAKNIKSNLLLAFGYNTLALPLAAGALYPSFGVLLSPMVASSLMILSSLSVILNSLRLKSFKL